MHPDQPDIIKQLTAPLVDFLRKYAKDDITVVVKKDSIEVSSAVLMQPSPPEKPKTHAIKAIQNLYSSKNGSTGGYGHIVFDDLNIEEYWIESCLKRATEDVDLEDGFCEETRITSITALKEIMLINEEERIQTIRDALFDLIGGEI